MGSIDVSPIKVAAFKTSLKYFPCTIFSNNFDSSLDPVIRNAVGRSDFKAAIKLFHSSSGQIF